ELPEDAWRLRRGHRSLREEDAYRVFLRVDAEGRPQASIPTEGARGAGFVASGDDHHAEPPAAVLEPTRDPVASSLFRGREPIARHFPDGVATKDSPAPLEQHPPEGMEVVRRRDEPARARRERRWLAPLPLGWVVQRELARRRVRDVARKQPRGFRGRH